MQLTLDREQTVDDVTLGKLYVDGRWQWWTLEDAVRASGVKIPGETAIPPGRYAITITYSVRFQRPLPLLLNVPGFSGIRIHPGNTKDNTAGCILVGGAVNKSTSQLSILYSRPACDQLQAQIAAVLARKEPVSIDIFNPGVVSPSGTGKVYL